MKAVLVDDNKRLYIGDVEDPLPKDDEILVKVKATAVNRADLLQKKGFYPPPPGASPIIGLEMSGVVEKTGSNVTNVNIGDRVCALLQGGGYAQFVTIPAKMAIPVPENLSFEEGAAIPEVFLTAFLSICRLGKLKAGETVLIHAGASGVGTAAIQIVKEYGGTAIVTVGSDKKKEACLSLGATAAINYKEESFKERVKEITDGKGVDIILDSIGATYWDDNLSSLATDGRIVIIATMSGAKVENLDLRQILVRRLQVIGTTLRARSVEEKISLTEEFINFGLERFSDGRLIPVIDNVWNWKDIEEAHNYMEKNMNIGKIIVEVG